MLPNVSLILTFLNRSPYLREALASVQAQTYPHYELILWDNGSTDRTGETATFRVTHQQPARACLG
jgi:glycosyltransferase involved in cell wall biosynthesis